MSQELVAPVSAELTREEAATVLENTEILGKCGFEVADFGDGDVLIRQIPCDVDEKDAVSLLQELAADLLAGKTLAPETLRDNLLHTIACKAAIKAGWHTEGAEAAHLVARDPVPHGYQILPARPPRLHRADKRPARAPVQAELNHCTAAA